MELSKDRVLPITGKVQNYGWGGYSYLANLLKFSAKKGETYAEFWLGTHERGSSEVRAALENVLSLKEYVSAFPLQTLGEKVAREFGHLPFLLKILDVRDMLSIQVHPTKQNAQAAFDRENEKGIDISSPERNFKDSNHKPELMLALSEFWLLHGFKTPQALQNILREIPELHFLVPVFGGDNYRKLYQHVMEMSQTQVDRHLQSLVERNIAHYQNGKLKESKEDFWAARAAITYAREGHIDRGIFSIYFFNLLHLNPGQAVFQDAGLPHAYLQGQNVEIMSNSDNVLRGGLTTKHIDVAELMKHVRFEPTIPDIIEGKYLDDHKILYPTPATDFELCRLQIQKEDPLSVYSHSMQIFLVFTGSVEVIENGGRGFQRSQGEAWVSFDAAQFEIHASEQAVVFQASIPAKSV